MTSLASFSKLLCATCNEVTLHDGVGCIHCRTPAVAPIARDIAVLSFGGQSEEATAKRLVRTGELARRRNTNPTPMRRTYRERPGTVERDHAVIRHLARGVTSQTAIARELGITPQGVWPIIKRAYKRFQIPLPAVGDKDHSVLIATARVHGVAL